MMFTNYKDEVKEKFVSDFFFVRYFDEYEGNRVMDKLSFF